MPRRLRACFLYDRRRLALPSRVAYRTLRDTLGAALGGREVASGAIACIQSFGALFHGHPHLHVLLTDGGFTREGTFLPAPPHEPAVLEEAWRRAVFRARRRRWAELLRRVFRVEVETCPRCGGAMRIVAFATEPAVVRRILAHRAQRGIEARAGPWAGAAAPPG